MNHITLNEPLTGVLQQFLPMIYKSIKATGTSNYGTGREYKPDYYSQFGSLLPKYDDPWNIPTSTMFRFSPSFISSLPEYARQYAVDVSVPIASTYYQKFSDNAKRGSTLGITPQQYDTMLRSWSDTTGAGMEGGGVEPRDRNPGAIGYYDPRGIQELLQKMFNATPPPTPMQQAPPPIRPALQLPAYTPTPQAQQPTMAYNTAAVPLPQLPSPSDPRQLSPSDPLKYNPYTGLGPPPNRSMYSTLTGMGNLSNYLGLGRR